MHALLTLVLLAGTFKNGRFEDDFWGVTYTAPELQRIRTFGELRLLFKGKCAGDLRVFVRVHEGPDVLSAKEWRKKLAPGHRGADTRVVYTEKDLAGFDVRVGRAFSVRGYHCFEVEARGEAGEDAIAAALDGIVVAPGAPGTLGVWRRAKELGRPVTDAKVLLDAGRKYASTDIVHRAHYPLAVQVLTHAARTMKKDSYTPEELWSLYETGGTALTTDGKPADAIPWLKKAIEAGMHIPEVGPERARQSAYNLACACSRAKRIDEAFAALDRAYEGGKPVTDGHVSGDKDLENCRRDERWHKFWREKVKG